MAERLQRRQDDHRTARSPDPPLRHHRDRKRQLALQKPNRRSHHNPRSRPLRNPGQLRRRERYRPTSSFERVKIGRRWWVKFGSRLTRWTKRHGRSFFGYKNHVNADAKHKLIRRYEVTDAAVHDSQKLDELLTKGNTSADVFGDSA